MTQQLTVTSGRALREQREQIVQFKSGNVYRLQRVSLLKLAALDEMPDFMRGFIVNQIKGSGSGALPITAAEVGKLGDMVKVVCRACMVDPHIVDVVEPGTDGVISDVDLIAVHDGRAQIAGALADDAITIDDMPLNDQFECLSWALGAAGAAAARFPDQRPSSVESVSTVD